MALSEAEEKWLEDRDAIQFATGEYLCGLYPEMLVDDFQDAAEFEARVQRWLMYQYEKAFQCKEVSGGFLPDRGTMLMFARLAVEQEMDDADRS